MLDPVPRRFHRVRLPVSSSVVIGLPQRRLGSAFPRLSANHDFSRSVFSRLQIFLNVPASKFARPPDRLYRCAYCRRAAGAFTSGQYRASLPLHAPDMLTVRIQAIDSTRTFTLLDSQPCRLLTFAPRTLLRFITTTGQSAPELRMRTLTLVVLPLVASPFSIEVQVPTFRSTASWQAQATSHAGCRSARKQVSSELVPQ